jgi:hypothetical protein
MQDVAKLSQKIQKAESSGEWPPGTPSKGSTHIRRTAEEHISLERTRQAEAGADARNVAPQEMICTTLRRQTPSSKNSSKSRKRHTKASPFFTRVLSLSNLS